MDKGIFWLRSAACMNDWSEIRRGQFLFSKYFQNPDRCNRLFNVLSKIDNQFKWKDNLKDLIEYFPEVALSDCYLASLTVHDKVDDASGRLSMWRGYGRGIGGALILKKNKIIDIDLGDVYLSKVAYFSEEEFIGEFNKFVDSLEERLDELKVINAETVWNAFKRAIIFAIVSIKDPGFKEEKEWRVLLFDSSSINGKEKVFSKTKVINGIPQRVYQLNIKSDLPDLLDHVIIGPTQYSKVAYTALKDDLSKLYEGTPVSIEGNLKMSTIPIRPETL